MGMTFPANTPEAKAKAAATLRRGPEIDTAIIANANGAMPISWRALSQKLDINLGTLLKHVKALRAINRIPKFNPAENHGGDRRTPEQRATADERRLHKAAGSVPKTDLSSILDVIEHDKGLSPEGRRAILNQIAINSTDNVRVVAISKLEDLERLSGARIGPPDPETPAQYAERLGRMLLAAGPKMVQLAIDWAAEHKEPTVAPTSKGTLGSDRHGDGQASGCGPDNCPTSPEPGPPTTPGGSPTPISAPQVPPSGGLDAEVGHVGP